MLTRARKKQKIEQKIHILVTVFPSLAQFLGTNDLTNLSMVCKDLQGAVSNTSRPAAASWHFVKEERRPTMIGYMKKKIDEGEEFWHDVTVSQIQPFKFCIAQQQNKLVVWVSIENELWEELDNRKIRDLDGPQQSTKISISFYSYRSPGNILFSYRDFEANNDVWASFLSGHTAEHGVYLGSEEHKNELRRSLSIIYACTKRISSWHDDANSSSYPSAEYLMRLLPKVVWPFFPQDFDWEVDHSDRTFVPEFSYHPAPDLEEWNHVVPQYIYDGPITWFVDSLPWYNPNEEANQTD